ncbi:hypothetical protein D9M71_850190 [compost metagenome]
MKKARIKPQRSAASLENAFDLVAQLINGEGFADQVHVVGHVDVFGITAGEQYRKGWT